MVTACVAVAGCAYTVDVEGSTTVAFRAADGAGNYVTAQGAVKVGPDAAGRHGHVHSGRQVAQVHLHREPARTGSPA